MSASSELVRDHIAEHASKLPATSGAKAHLAEHQAKLTSLRSKK